MENIKVDILRARGKYSDGNSGLNAVGRMRSRGAGV